jgi:hypothetical protein
MVPDARTNVSTREVGHLQKLTLQFCYIFAYMIGEYGHIDGFYRLSIAMIPAMYQSTDRLSIAK